jgi:prepilin-type N-terminal cleavage/methylation domain-containing protein
MHSQRGFTLVEVLAAFLILMFVVTTSLYAFLARNKRLQQASEIVLAYQALANEAEYRRRDRFDELEGRSPKFVSETDLLESMAPFRTAVTVELVKPGVKNVTMTIHWHNEEREARLVVLRVDPGGGGTFF